MMLGRKHGWGPFLFCFTGIQEYFVSLSPTDLRGSGLQDRSEGSEGEPCRGPEV